MRDAAYSFIRDAIHQGTLGPGDRIVEYKLASALGVSQGPIREALQRLVAEGVVVSVKHVGTFVRPVSRADLEAVLVVRGALEALAVDLAFARGIDDADIGRLKIMYVQMQAAANADDLTSLVDADVRFHETVVSLSGNAALVETAAPLFQQIRSFIAVTHIVLFENLNAVVHAHEGLLDALSARDVRQARREVRLHSTLAHASTSAQG